MKFQSPKGTKDVLPEEQPYWEWVEDTIRHIVRLYGYERLDLPIFESTGLYERGVGEGTDIVEKEMYTFTDKAGNSLTLRPEFTAGVMRAYLQNGMASLPKPVKVWSMGPVFRYERPQAGRFRQHTQFNLEAIGEADPALDFEVMSIAYHLYEKLGFRQIAFQLNSIGCPKCRSEYLKALVQYYQQHLNEICEECKRRLSKNPLRVLDCKSETCQPVIDQAPQILQFLCAECAGHFKTLRMYLEDHQRPYTLNHRLVRGLDYYTRTVFEVWAEGIGAQNAVCGGGRYDGLAEALGGPPTPGVGFASGIERIVLILQHQNLIPPQKHAPWVYIVHIGEKAQREAVRLVSQLRKNGIPSIMGFGDRSAKAQFREADARRARFAVVLGESELAQGVIQLKSLSDGTQETLSQDQLIAKLLKEKKSE